MLSALNMEELLVLGEFIQTKKLAEGLTFCDPRAEATQAGIVLSGEMISFGSEGVHQYMGPGDWIAEEVLLQGSRSYPHRVRTASSVELVVIRIEDYDKFLERLGHLHNTAIIASSPYDLRIRCAMSSTDIGYAATSSTVTAKLMHWFSHKGQDDQHQSSRNAAHFGSTQLRDATASHHNDRNIQSSQSSGQISPSPEAWRMDDDSSAIDGELDHAYQLHHLGMLQFDLKNTRAARRLLQEACQIRMLRLGPHSPVTMSTVRWLERVAKWQFRQKDREVQFKTMVMALKNIIRLGGMKGALPPAAGNQGGLPAPAESAQASLPGLEKPEVAPPAKRERRPSIALAEGERPQGGEGTSLQVRSLKDEREWEETLQRTDSAVEVVDEEEHADARELVGGSYEILQNRGHWIASMIKFAHGMRPPAPVKMKKLTAKLTGDRAIQHKAEQVVVLEPEEARLRAVSRALKEMSEEWKGSHRAVVGILGQVCRDVVSNLAAPSSSPNKPERGGGGGPGKVDQGKQPPAVESSSSTRLDNAEERREAYHQMLQAMSGQRHGLVSDMLHSGQCRRFGDGLCLLDLQAHRMQQWFPLTLLEAYDTVERVRWECATGLQLAGRGFVARRKLKFERSIRALQRAWRGRVARRELRSLRVKKMAMWTEKKHTVGHDEAGWESRMRMLRQTLEEAGHAGGGLEAEAGFYDDDFEDDGGDGE